MQITETSKAISSLNSVNERLPTNQMGKDEFMQILVAQLRNQDPLSPMEDKDFIAQIAQFSTLEQIQSMNEGATFAQAAALVGKEVYSVITDSNGFRKEISGIVDSVMTINKMPYLEVKGHLIPYSTNLIISNGNHTGVPEEEISEPSEPSEVTEPSETTEVTEPSETTDENII